MKDSQIDRAIRILEELDIEIEGLEDVETVKCSIGLDRTCPCDDPRCDNPPGCKYHNS